MVTSTGAGKASVDEPRTAYSDTAQRFRPPRIDFANFKPHHFVWNAEGRVATIALNRPERKNPLTLESYAELRDTFRDLVYADAVKCVVITGAGGNFCSGGDVHEIIGPLVEMQRKGDTAGLLAFTRMTGDLVKAMRTCPQPIVAAIDGVCAGAGAILAMASDLRLGTARSKVAFLFVRVGLAGADMGAAYLLPHKDIEQGLKWMRLSAEQGNQDAQLLLGKAYLGGELPREPVQADMWLRLAAKDNLDFYKNELRVAEGQMTPEQIAQGKTLADNWKPKHGLRP